jgi:hypothetical protein
MEYTNNIFRLKFKYDKTFLKLKILFGLKIIIK